MAKKTGARVSHAWAPLTCMLFCIVYPQSCLSPSCSPPPPAVCPSPSPHSVPLFLLQSVPLILPIGPLSSSFSPVPLLHPAVLTLSSSCCLSLSSSCCLSVSFSCCHALSSSGSPVPLLILLSYPSPHPAVLSFFPSCCLSLYCSCCPVPLLLLLPVPLLLLLPVPLLLLLLSCFVLLLLSVPLLLLLSCNIILIGVELIKRCRVRVMLLYVYKSPRICQTHLIERTRRLRQTNFSVLAEYAK